METDVEEVLEIVEAYEIGYRAGRMNFSYDTNIYQDKSPCFYAWLLGHNSGLEAELFELDEVRPN
jgi:hypothetical protein